MKNWKFIIVIVSICFISFDTPCTKKIIRENGIVIELFYPSCADSTKGLSRKFKNGSLVSETWFADGHPFGPEINYTDTLLSQFTIWDNKDVLSSHSYYPHTHKPKNMTRKISDSVYYAIEYFQNGAVASHGLLTAEGCRFGTWTEFDSLGLTKWSGKYKIVQKESRSQNEGAVIQLTWCYEKDSVWAKTDKTEKLLEKKLFINGKEKKGHSH